MKRALLWKFYRSSQRAAVESLQKKGLIEIAVWVGRGRSCDVNIDNLYALRIGTHEYSGIAAKFYDEIRDEILPTFIDMYSRVPGAQSASHQEVLNAYNLYYDYFAQLLQRKQIELALFNNLPHFGMDLLLYHLAKKMGIRTIIFTQSHIPNRCYCMEELDDYGRFSNHPKLAPNLNMMIERRHEKKHFYMAKIPLKFRSCGYNLVNEMRRILFRRKSRMPLMSALDKFFKCRMYKQRIARYSFDHVDLDAKFVYFPLHLQPELTTSALGGVYADQLLALEKLSQMLPEDWKIYVKENPKQLEQQRGSLFFKRLTALEKAVLVSSNVDTYALTKGCRFVASIAGTVGWEAISGGKPTLIFGMVWYRSLPGVFEYRDRPSLEEILSCKIDHEQLQRKYNALFEKTIEGVVDPAYAMLVKDYDSQKNAETFAASMQKVIEG